MVLRIEQQGGGLPEKANGVLRLGAECSWVVEGPDDELDELAAALPARSLERVGAALRVSFVNEVGTYHLPHLGVVEVHTGKWSEAHFEAMLELITQQLAALPFRAGIGGCVAYDRTITREKRVLYQTFVYLRHALSDLASAGERLPPALEAIVRDPHRRFDRIAPWVPIGAASRLAPNALLSILHPLAGLHAAPRSRLPLVNQLHGHLPQNVQQSAVRSTPDVAENRFIKAFLDQALAIIEAMRSAVRGASSGAFRARIEADCDRMRKALMVFRNAPLWSDVGDMHRLPAESPLLQRRRGYREVYRHFLRMRMTARFVLPCLERLLEVKNIASLYELWCFFRVESALSKALDRKPINAAAAQITDFAAHLPFDLRVAWDCGIALCYNRRFGRHDTVHHSYSIPLRPDLVLSLPRGPNAGDHIFDAKFRLRRLEDFIVTGAELSEDDVDAERRGVFKVADLCKMHTYRDAITSARTAWILYPGSEFIFFPCDEAGDKPSDEKPIRSVSHLPVGVTGVGAIPLQPDDPCSLEATIRILIQSFLGPVANQSAIAVSSR